MEKKGRIITGGVKNVELPKKGWEGSVGIERVAKTESARLAAVRRRMK